MDFNKCNRCGNFYISQGDVCPKCQAKDDLDYNSFKSYISDNGIEMPNKISEKLNIPTHHISRYLGYIDNASQTNIDEKINSKNNLKNNFKNNL